MKVYKKISCKPQNKNSFLFPFFISVIFVLLSFPLASKAQSEINSWNDFVVEYQHNESSSNLTLIQNIDASKEIKDAPLAFGETIGDNFIISGGAQAHSANASNKADLSFVFENKQSITFSNIGLLNFRSSDKKEAAVIKAQNSEIIFAGAINLQSSAGTISDIDIDENSSITFDNVNFINGIRISGAGQTIKSGESVANFNGQPSVIDGNLQVLGGEINFNSNAQINTLNINTAIVNFKSAASSITTVNLRESATISLINNNVSGRLFIRDLSVSVFNGLGFDVDFSNGNSDRIIVSGSFEKTYVIFSINPLQNGNGIAILMQAGNIINIDVETDNYTIYGGGHFIFIRPKINGSSQADIIKAADWGQFVDEYNYAPQVADDWIKLSSNLNADLDDQSIGNTQAAVNFNIDGNHHVLNANSHSTGFTFNNNNITFKDIEFSNFVGNEGAIMSAQNSRITFTGDINFNSNPKAYSDIELDENSRIEFNNVNFINGIRVSGKGRTTKSASGIANFSGSPTIFYGDLAVLGGQVIFNSDVKLETLALNNATVNFKSAYSSANIVYAANNAAISLANNYLPNALFAEEISLNADLILDVNFNSASSDKIYASSITIFTGRKLIINAPFYDELIVKKIPIIFSEDYFAFNQNGNSINNTENIFYYDSTRYDLYFDIGQKVLYIKNVLPPDQNSAKTRNQKEIENIVNENGYLKYPISNMNANKKRLSYDDLSGAFYANIFSAMLYGGNESIFNQIEQIPSYKLWTNVNISGLRFHNNGQTIGDFKTEGFGIMLGKDLQAAEWGRMGAFVSGNDRKFSQAQNRGDLQDIGIGVYGNLFFKGFNSKGIFSAMYAGGRVEREINFNESYYRPHSNISLIGFNAAISLDYMVLAQNKNDLQRLVGPVFSYEANQINIFPTKEMDGSIANLYFDSQPIFRHAVKGGMEFRQTNKGLEFFGRIFIGRNLNAKQEFDMEILDLRRTFKVESDDENLLFYGWLTGVNLSLTQSINLGMQAGMQTNGNFQSYNANLNANYKFSKTIKPRANRKTIKTKIPVLEFIDGTAELTPKSKTELASFGQRLAKTFPNFRRLTIFIMLNNSNDRGSARASEVSAARARNVKRILYANKVPPEKIWDATRKIRTRGRIAVRVAR